jgi:phage terminase large subunit-like protein
LSEAEAAALNFEWRRWARPSQIMPGGEWYGWLIIAGRGWGKTRTGAEAVREEVESGRSRRIGLVGETAADGRKVIVEGDSGLLAISPPWFMPVYKPSQKTLTWPNGAIATLYDAREPDQLRGPQHDFIWFDELAKFRYAEAIFDQAMFGLRRGDRPRWAATTTPRPIALIKRLLSHPGVIVTRGKSDDNLANIAKSFERNVIARYRGTRLGRQELDAEILEDIPGALWSRRSLDEARVKVAPNLVRIVVAVDPPATSGENANEAGIIVCGVAADKQAYILEDWSRRCTPDEWGRKAVAAYRKHEADCIVAECNQGGEMVESVIKSVADVPVKLVRATRGKYVRAEPASALYEQGRVHHVGTFPDLEDQMIGFTPERASDRSDGFSPDRVDALVWGLTELFPEITSGAKRGSARIEMPNYGIV